MHGCFFAVLMGLILFNNAAYNPIMQNRLTDTFLYSYLSDLFINYR